MNLTNSLKEYFDAKINGNESEKSPKGVCPNCWGEQEWDGEFYKIIKGKNTTPESKIYTSFINELVKKFDKNALTEDTYICKTCSLEKK